jgi:hypothetical protein
MQSAFFEFSQAKFEFRGRTPRNSFSWVCYFSLFWQPLKSELRRVWPEKLRSLRVNECLMIMGREFGKIASCEAEKLVLFAN